MATNNDFVSLAVPVSAGTGGASDVSDMASGLSLVVDAPGSTTGEVVIEGSENGTDFVPVTSVFPLHNPPQELLKHVLKFARVVRFSGSGPAAVALGAAKTGLNLFGTLSLTPLDTSEHGPLKSISVHGQYVQPIVIEGSNDGVNYDAVANFATQDSDLISIEGTWVAMRVRPNTNLSGVSVSIGSGFVAGAGGGGGGGGVTQIVAGTNVTISPLSGLGVVTVNATGGGGGGGILSINGDVTPAQVIAGSTGIKAATAGGTTSIDQVLVADWPQPNIRVYAIDGVNGNDANLGFADAADPSSGAYATACQLAGSRAFRTFAALAAVFPKYGNGRLVEIVIANGGVNTAEVYHEDLVLFLGSCFGYADGCPVARGTGTNANAGCVKFDGSTNDVTYAGGVTVTGLNATGYNPLGATAGSIPCTRVGGGGPAFPAEPAAPLGWRIRFAINTTTVALQGVCRSIARVTGGNTLVPESILPHVPVNGDVFFVEQAGVTYSPSGNLVFGGTGNGNAAAQICGLQTTVGILLDQASFRFIFCGSSGNLVFTGYGNDEVSQTLNHPVLGPVTVGGGLRVGINCVSDGGPLQLTAAGLVCGAATHGGGFVFTGLSQLDLGAGCYSLDMQVIDHNGSRSVNSAIPDIGIFDTFNLAPPRTTNLQVSGSTVLFGAFLIENSGGTPAISLFGQCEVQFTLPVTGVTGNTDVGLDLINSFNSLILINQFALPTVTGTLGDIRLADGTIITWAEAASGFVDGAGNRFVGTSSSLGSPTGYIAFTGLIQGAAGATQSYLADGGIVGGVNQTTPFNRPTSPRMFTRLRVSVIGNTSVNPVTVALIKNGAPTGMTVTIPAGSVADQQILTQKILVLDTDKWDLRMDDPAGDGEGTVSISASLEYAS